MIAVYPLRLLQNPAACRGWPLGVVHQDDPVSGRVWRRSVSNFSCLWGTSSIPVAGPEIGANTRCRAIAEIGVPASSQSRENAKRRAGVVSQPRAAQSTDESVIAFLCLSLGLIRIRLRSARCDPNGVAPGAAAHQRLMIPCGVPIRKNVALAHSWATPPAPAASVRRPRPSSKVARPRARPRQRLRKSFSPTPAGSLAASTLRIVTCRALPLRGPRGPAIRGPATAAAG